MTDEANQDNQESSDDNSAIDMASEVLTGIPAPIKKSFFKVVNQLCTAAVDVPVAHLEGKAAEKRAETSARVKLIETGAKQIADQMNVSPEFAQIAVEKHCNRIIRESVNLDSIVKIAADDLKMIEHEDDVNSEHSEEQEKPISDDWLNTFEEEACNKSTEEMKLLFGKILAGEIKKPGTFSIRTIKILSQLDNKAANLFQLLCSLSVTQKYEDVVDDSRVISFSGSAASNSLSGYGLNFSNLNLLEEYGLIISDYNSFSDYRLTRHQEGSYVIPLVYQNENYCLVPIGETDFNQPVKLHGVGFSSAGKEILSIVDVQPNQNYTSDLIEYFKSINLTLTRI